jgi:hypothetical protein
MASISTARCRFQVGSIISNEISVNGSVAGVLVGFPVAATVSVQVQIDSNLAGYTIPNLTANIASDADLRCLLLPDEADLTGARMRFTSSVPATTLVDCFVLIRTA